MKIAKKVLAIVMAVSMLLSTASTVLANGTEGNASIKDSSISDLMNANDINRGISLASFCSRSLDSSDKFAPKSLDFVGFSSWAAS